MTVTKRKKTATSTTATNSANKSQKKKKKQPSDKQQQNKKKQTRKNSVQQPPTVKASTSTSSSSSSNSADISRNNNYLKEALYFKGCTLFDEHRSLEAIHFLKQALDLDENCAECLNAISVAYDDLQEYEKVVHYLERLHSVKPIVQCDMIIFTAKSYLGCGRVDEAEIWVNKVETEELDLYVDALRTKAMIYDARAEYHLELQTFKIICEDLGAGNAQDWNNFALTYHVLLKHEDALKSILKSIELDPKTSEWYISEAMIRQELGNDGDSSQYQSAIIACLKVLELESYPLDDDNNNNNNNHSDDEYGDAAIKRIERTFSLLGSIYGNMKDHEESERYLRKSIGLCPDNYEAMNNLAISLMKQKRCEEAIDYVNHAIQIDASKFDAYDTLGQIHVKLKNFETAVHFLRKAIELNPESFVALRHLEKCFRLVHESYNYDPQNPIMKRNNHLQNTNSEHLDNNAASSTGSSISLPGEIRDWSMEHVAQFVRSTGLPQYVQAFHEHEVDGTVLSKLNETHLEKMGVTKIGHQLLILEEIKTRLLSSSQGNVSHTSVKGENLPPI